MSQPGAIGGGDSIVTGEAVVLDLRVARLPSRALAAALDLGLELILLTASTLVVTGVTRDAAAGAAVQLSVLVVILVGYPVGLETLWRGRTLGKAALGLRVVRDDGGPIGFRQALVRGLTGVFLERPGISLFVIGVVCQLVSGRGKRLGDVLAGTVVLQERVAVRGGVVAVMPPQLAGWAATADLSRLPDDLALAARQFLGRSAELTAGAREDLGGRLSAALAERVSPPPPPGTPGWAYLSAVLAERRRRDERRMAAVPARPPPAPDPEPDRAPATGQAPSAGPTPGPGGFVVPG
ncbi:MAG: RDD family protein [Actinomycetota bacterium]|nr:RDD family protein [Actinomycetota bacterium]